VFGSSESQVATSVLRRPDPCGRPADGHKLGRGHLAFFYIFPHLPFVTGPEFLIRHVELTAFLHKRNAVVFGKYTLIFQKEFSIWRNLLFFCLSNFLYTFAKICLGEILKADLLETSGKMSAESDLGI
jgi:hypothetical protein